MVCFHEFNERTIVSKDNFSQIKNIYKPGGGQKKNVIGGEIKSGVALEIESKCIAIYQKKTFNAPIYVREHMTTLMAGIWMIRRWAKFKECFKKYIKV